MECYIVRTSYYIYISNTTKSFRFTAAVAALTTDRCTLIKGIARCSVPLLEDAVNLEAKTMMEDPDATYMRTSNYVQQRGGRQ